MKAFQLLKELDYNGLSACDWTIEDTNNRSEANIAAWPVEQLGYPVLSGEVRLGKTYLCVWSNTYGESPIDVDADVVLKENADAKDGVFLYLISDAK